MWDVLSVAAHLPAITPAAADAIEKFARMIEHFRARLKHDPLVEVVSAMITDVGYQDELARLYKDPQERQARWAAVEEVVNALGAYEKRAKRPTLAGFVEEIALGDRDNEQDKDEQLQRNAIALMTLHSAKGLEFPQVYLVGMEEGLLPHRRSVEMEGTAIDEERRLCYVGITRARDRLTISLALSRMKWGKPRPTQPSRFLFEVTGQADRAHRGPTPSARPTKRPARPKPSTRPATSASASLSLGGTGVSPVRDSN